MDDTAAGRVFRAVRLRRGLTQQQLAARAGTSQPVVSRIERGHLENVTVGRMRRIAGELEIRLPIAPSWRGGDAARLLDGAHASLVEAVVARLVAMGWTSRVEVTFNDYGERGSIDILGWHPARSALLVIEVKSRLVDVQDLLSGVDRKERLGPMLAGRQLGWRPRVVGVVVVLAAGSTARGAVERHRAIFAAALPARTTEVTAWLADPGRPLRGIWLVRGTAPRVRVRRGASSPWTT